MAVEYVKIWTTFESDPWIQSLNCNQRGLFLQLILFTKSGGSPHVTGRSYSAIAQRSGCDDSTCAKFLRKFAEDGKISLTNPNGRVIQIEVLNYDYWQGLKGEKGVIEKVKERRKIREKSGEIPPSNISQVTTREVEAPPETTSEMREKVTNSFNKFCVDNAKEYLEYWAVNYAHIGGEAQLRDCTQEIRDLIFTDPFDVNIQRHYREGTWGRLIKSWNKNKVRARETR